MARACVTRDTKASTVMKFVVRTCGEEVAPSHASVTAKDPVTPSTASVTVSLVIRENPVKCNAIKISTGERTVLILAPVTVPTVTIGTVHVAVPLER